MKSLLVFILLSWVVPAQARVFNFKSEHFASYFRGSLGLSRLERTTYKPASGLNTSYVGDEHQYNFSGELGFLFNISEPLTLRVGAEVLQSKVSEIVGNNSSGTKLFDLSSDVFVFNPMATVEWHFIAKDTMRLSGFIGAGMASLSMDNAYTFTSAGLSAFSLSQSYVEKSEAFVVSAHYGGQFEFLLADTVTMVTEAGFRYMTVGELKYKHDTTTIVSQELLGGAAPKGSVVKYHDVSNRTFDMSGYYLVLSFRLYLRFL